MPEPPESLDAAAIRSRLRTEIGLASAEKFDLRIIAETGSTNDDVSRFGEAGAGEGLVIFADSQTAGRGRRGDAWISPPGFNLLFSILLRPAAPIATWVRIPHLAGVAICRGIESALPDLPEAIQLKWPNDLYLLGRKLGGILIESRSGSGSGNGESAFAVLGAGINVNLPAEGFPEALRPIATSLHEHLDRVISRNAIAASILAEWSAIYPDGVSNFEPVREEISRRSLLRDREISVQTGGTEIVGIARGFGPDGELLVAEDDKDLPTAIRSADLVRLVSA